MSGLCMYVDYFDKGVGRLTLDLLFVTVCAQNDRNFPVIHISNTVSVKGIPLHTGNLKL